MVCSESELRLVELFTFPGETKSLRKVRLGQLAWGCSPNNFCQEKNYITFKNSSCACENLILKEFYIIPSKLSMEQYGIFDYQSLEISVLFTCSPGIRNYYCKSKISLRQLSNTSKIKL